MDRRAFLKTTAASAVLPWHAAFASSDWRTYQVVTRVEILKPQGVSRVWLPLPLKDDMPWQRNQGSQWSGNAARTEVLPDGKYGVTMLFAEWNGGQPVLELTSRFATRDTAVDLSRPPSDAARLSDAERRFYTAPSDFIPTDGIVRETATGIVKNARSDLHKGRAIY